MHGLMEACGGIVKRFRGLWRSSALEMVIILHDPFFSRAAVPEGSMVVSTAQTRGRRDHAETRRRGGGAE